MLTSLQSLSQSAGLGHPYAKNKIKAFKLEQFVEGEVIQLQVANPLDPLGSIWLNPHRSGK